MATIDTTQELMDAEAINAAADYTGGLKHCWAEGCRFNTAGICDFKGIEIGANGQCITYEKRTEPVLRSYLKARGLPPQAIEQIIKEAGE